MATYQAVNISGRSDLIRRTRRQTLIIDGSRVEPEDTIHFDELTSDVLKAIEAGTLRVYRDQKEVTFKSLRAEGYEIVDLVVSETKYGADGPYVVHSRGYRIRKAGATDGERVIKVDNADTGGDAAKDDAGDPEADAPQAGAQEEEGQAGGIQAEETQVEEPEVEKADAGEEPEVEESEEGEEASEAVLTTSLSGAEAIELIKSGKSYSLDGETRKTVLKAANG